MGASGWGVKLYWYHDPGNFSMCLLTVTADAVSFSALPVRDLALNQ